MTVFQTFFLLFFFLLKSLICTTLYLLLVFFVAQWLTHMYDWLYIFLLVKKYTVLLTIKINKIVIFTVTYINITSLNSFIRLGYCMSVMLSFKWIKFEMNEVRDWLIQSKVNPLFTFDDAAGCPLSQTHSEMLLCI